MRKILIAIVALLVLCGGGAGAYFYFAQPAEASSGEVEKGAEEHDKKAEHKGKGGGGHGEGAVEYVKLDPLILPIVDNNGLTQVVSLVIAIEVSDAEAKKTVEQLVPRLNDAFIQDLYGVLSDHSAVKSGVIQVGIIKDRLNKITVRVLGEDMGTDVLLQVVQQRPA